jgi:hypothetical protein
MQDQATFDRQLINVLSTGVNARSATMPIANADTGQAVDVSRLSGRFSGPARIKAPSAKASTSPATFLSPGFLYERDALTVNLVTDGTGLLSPQSNIFIAHQDASKGSGFAIDLGAGVVVDKWRSASA